MAAETISSGILQDILTRMIRVRRFEEKVASLSKNREIITPVHLYVGQEAIAAGVSANLTHNDFVLSTHRSHGHYIAKGGSLNKLMAEIFCKENGCSHGHGGSMHIVDRSVGYMGSSAIVAGTISIAVGTALSIKMDHMPHVAVAYFGDGATDEGVFYESINLAVIYKLPIIFVCENNLFSTHLPISMRQGNVQIHKRVEGFNIPTVCVDGNNSIEVYLSSKKLIENARNGGGPSLLECMTYRWLAHVGSDEDLDVGFRTKKDVEHWKQRCPIKHLSETLIEKKQFSTESLKSIETMIDGEISETIEYSSKSGYPSVSNISRGLWAN